VVLLIACDHFAAQTFSADTELNDPLNTKRREFRELLLKSIDQFDPTLIAEEHHPEILEKRNRRSIAIEVASETNIRHRFCEPSFKDKEELGINGPQSELVDKGRQATYNYFLREWPIREEFWIDQLGEDIHQRVLFVCGAHHRETLRRRLERRKIEVKIIEKRFGASKFPKSDFPAYKAAYRELRRNGFMPVS